jgi:hypothetical protein
MTDHDEDLIGHLATIAAAVLNGQLPAARAAAADLAALLDLELLGADLAAEVRMALRFDPVGLAEISAMTGESKQNLNYLMAGSGVPAPVRLARMKVWRRQAVVVWWASIGREVSWTDEPAG